MVPAKKANKFSAVGVNDITLKIYRSADESLEDAKFLGEFRITNFKFNNNKPPSVEVTIATKDTDIVLYVRDLNSKNIVKIERIDE